MVCRAVGYLITGNHVALCVNSSLYIVAYTETFVGFHQSGVRVNQRNLALTALLKHVTITLVSCFALLAYSEFSLQLIL